MKTTIINAPTLVIADDDHEILNMLELVLTRAGFNVHQCWNAFNIHEKIKQSSPDMIILDITMLGIDGGEVCKALRNPPHSLSIPIIMISANYNLKQIAQECEATGYISKPFKTASLVALINEHLKNHQN